MTLLREVFASANLLVSSLERDRSWNLSVPGICDALQSGQFDGKWINRR
jgi:hypothetical protein